MPTVMKSAETARLVKKQTRKASATRKKRQTKSVKRTPTSKPSAKASKRIVATHVDGWVFDLVWTGNQLTRLALLFALVAGAAWSAGQVAKFSSAGYAYCNEPVMIGAFLTCEGANCSASEKIVLPNIHDRELRRLDRCSRKTLFNPI